MENIEIEHDMDTAEVPEVGLYEIGYLIAPFIAEENLSQESNKIKGIVSSHGGSVSSEGTPKSIQLAYSMTKTIANKNTKFERAYFGWVKFNATSEVVEKIQNDLGKVDSLVRYILMKTTDVPPQAPRVPRKRVVRPSEKETEPLDVAALDKELEGLLVE